MDSVVVISQLPFGWCTVFFSVVDQVQEKQEKSQESRIPEILIELDFIYGSCISLVEKSLSALNVKFSSFVICRLSLI